MVFLAVCPPKVYSDNVGNNILKGSEDVFGAEHSIGSVESFIKI